MGAYHFTNARHYVDSRDVRHAGVQPGVHGWSRAGAIDQPGRSEPFAQSKPAVVQSTVGSVVHLALIRRYDILYIRRQPTS